MDKVKNTSVTIAKQKRERSVNFTNQETELLIALAISKKHILENKKSNGNTWKEKENTWIQIEKAFNRRSDSVFRDYKNLKLKYEAIKRDTRKKSAIIQSESYKTGEAKSTIPEFTPAELKVKERILSNEGTSTTDSILLEEQNIEPAAVEESIKEDSSINLFLEIVEEDREPPKKKVCKVSQEEGEQDELDTESLTESLEWKQWNTTALNSKMHLPYSEPKEKIHYNKSKEKIEIAEIQKKIIAEELEQKLLQKKILETDLEHKFAIQELQKEHLLLKIEILKKSLNK